MKAETRIAKLQNRIETLAKQAEEMKNLRDRASWNSNEWFTLNKAWNNLMDRREKAIQTLKSL